MARYLELKNLTFFANLYYFFTYQVDYMYIRYFMWNFVGRQDDVQGNYDILHGNWISGFPLSTKFAGQSKHFERRCLEQQSA